MILVDQPLWRWQGRYWSHLVSDESYDELHRFAADLGIPRRAFQGDHYDLPSDYRSQALKLGAHPVDSRELVARLRTAGLRLSPGARRANRSGSNLDVAASVGRRSVGGDGNKPGHP